MGVFNGDKFDMASIDRWTYRVEIMSKLVANVGFPILVASALLVVIWRALPTLEMLNVTMMQVSANLSVNTEHEEELSVLLREQSGALQLHDRKDDQYHQDYMLSHPYPLPSDPPKPKLKNQWGRAE